MFEVSISTVYENDEPVNAVEFCIEKYRSILFSPISGKWYERKHPQPDFVYPSTIDITDRKAKSEITIALIQSLAE